MVLSTCQPPIQEHTVDSTDKNNIKLRGARHEGAWGNRVSAPLILGLGIR